MKGKVIYMSPEDNRFETISDFKWYLKCGGEIQFRWKGIDYGVVRYGINKKSPHIVYMIQNRRWHTTLPTRH